MQMYRAYVIRPNTRHDNYINNSKKSTANNKNVNFFENIRRGRPCVCPAKFEIVHNDKFCVCLQNFLNRNNFHKGGLVKIPPYNPPLIPAEGCRVDFRIALRANCENNAPRVRHIRGVRFKSCSFSILNVLKSCFLFLLVFTQNIRNIPIIYNKLNLGEVQ